VRAVLNDSGRKTVAQISRSFAAAVNDELALAADPVTAGKLVTAIKLLGFDKVFDATVAANAVYAEISGEVKQRGNDSHAKLPVISGCSAGVANFVKNFYPDLADRLTAVSLPRRYFASSIKSGYAKETGVEISNITSASFLPCLAHKYGADDKTDFAITAGELARMLKIAGIVIETLPEEPFEPQPSQANQRFAGEGFPLDVIGIGSKKQDSSITKETVHGYAQARKVMEAIREGKCDAQWVEILSCPGDSCDKG
jgi:iron only hydrogenase large subunit-like protein